MTSFPRYEKPEKAGVSPLHTGGVVPVRAEVAVWPSGGGGWHELSACSHTQTPLLNFNAGLLAARTLPLAVASSHRPGSNLRHTVTARCYSCALGSARLKETRLQA